MATAPASEVRATTHGSSESDELGRHRLFRRFDRVDFSLATRLKKLDYAITRSRAETPSAGSNTQKTNAKMLKQESAKSRDRLS